MLCLLACTQERTALQYCSTQTTSVFLVSASGNSSQRSQSFRSGQIRAVARLKRRSDSTQEEEHRCGTSHIPTSAGTLSHLHCGKWVNFTPFNKFLVTLFMVLTAEKQYKSGVHLEQSTLFVWSPARNSAFTTFFRELEGGGCVQRSSSEKNSCMSARERTE